jgi:hypothetical protein
MLEIREVLILTYFSNFGISYTPSSMQEEILKRKVLVPSIYNSRTRTGYDPTLHNSSPVLVILSDFFTYEFSMKTSHRFGFINIFWLNWFRDYD